MSTISCTHELCELDQHEADYLRHMRITSDPEARHRAVAWWTGDDAASGSVTLTHEGTTVSLDAASAAFWARLLCSDGMWTPVAGSGTSRIAIDLGAAAEVLFYLTPDGVPPDFGRGYLDLAIRSAVADYFADEDDEVYA